MQVSVLLLAASLWFGVARGSTSESAPPPPPPFQCNSTEWSPANALALAEAASFAYHKEAGAEVIKRLGCERFENLVFRVPLPPKFKFEEGEPGPQGFIAGGPRQIVIAFRGTEINI